MLIVPVVGVDVLRHGAAQQRDDLKDADLMDANLLPYNVRDPERLSLHNLKRTDRRMDLSREKLRPRRPMLHPRRLAITRRGHWWPTIMQHTTANLKQAILTDAHLPNAYLEGADLSDADLRTIDPKRTTNLHGAKLIGTRLRNTRLDGTDLTNADLSKADLKDADLKDANLRGAKYLTQEQIERAIEDHKTRLASHLRRPESWSGSSCTGEKGEWRD